MNLTDVSQFLYEEARLIDERRLRDWLGLFAENSTYWIPVNPDSTDPERDVSIIYDSNDQRDLRVRRLLGMSSPTQDPPMRTLHFISNICVAEDEGRVNVRSNQLIWQSRNGDEEVFQASCLHELVEENGELRIKNKKVSLLTPNRVFTSMVNLF